MLMNSVPNSDSEQYTESKLGWVHQVHTQNPSCAPTMRLGRALSRIVARSGTVSWPSTGRVVGPLRPYSGCSTRTPACAVPRVLQLCTPYRSAAACCIAIQPSNQAASSHDTIYYIATQSPSQAPRTRDAGRVVGVVGRVVACHARRCAPRPVSQAMSSLAVS